VVRVTGLRNPCTQLDDLDQGLMGATLDRDGEGALVRKAGIMGVVVDGSEVRTGDVIEISLPSEPHEKLERV
jgi:MOSC domain-containing protein YiiM